MLETFTDRVFGEDFTRLVNSVEKIASAAKTAADAYAEKTRKPVIVVNVSTEPNVLNANDVAKAVSNAMKLQDR